MSLSVDRYELGPIGTNCYVVRAAPDAGEAVVIDPGGEAATLALELEAKRAACVAILITHGHWDHLGERAGHLLPERLLGGQDVVRPARRLELRVHATRSSRRNGFVSSSRPSVVSGPWPG